MFATPPPDPVPPSIVSQLNSQGASPQGTGPTLGNGVPGLANSSQTQGPVQIATWVSAGFGSAHGAELPSSEPERKDTLADIFLQNGYVVVPGVFNAETANSCRVIIEAALNDRCLMQRPYSPEPIALQTHFRDGPFERIMNWKFRDCLDQLLGRDLWEPRDAWGWFSITRPRPIGSPRQNWQPVENGWHVDSQIDLKGIPHRQALIAILLFSDIAPGEGGTAVSCGSHNTITRLLNRSEEPMTFEAVNAAVRGLEHRDVREIIGTAGSVAFLHPHLVHAASLNTTNQLRIIANPLFSLRSEAHLNFSDAPGVLHSPLERSIVDALRASPV